MIKAVASLLLVGAVLSGCSASGLVNALTPHATYRSVNDVAYGTGPRQHLDVYLPVHPAPGPQGAPVVVFFYGGSWQSGERADYRFAGEALASRGFIVLVPDYRTYPTSIFPGFMTDAACAVRWAHDHAASYGGDPARLFLVGHSAGAQIATLLATDSQYLVAQGLRKHDLAGVVGLAGPYDFLPLRSAKLMEIFPEPIRAASQPINFVHGDEPPMFLAFGSGDTIVESGNTARFASRLEAAHDSVEVRRYPGLGHLLLVGALSAPLRLFLPVLDDISAFITAPNLKI